MDILKQLNTLLNNETLEEAPDKLLQSIADIAKGKKLVNLRTPLEGIFKKKEIDFVMSPIPHFRIKSGGKTIVIVNKKYADDAEIIVDEIAIGYEGKI